MSERQLGSEPSQCSVGGGMLFSPVDGVKRDSRFLRSLGFCLADRSGRCVKVAGWRPSNRGRVSSSVPVAVQSFFRALFREEREPRGRGGSDPSGRALYHRGSGSPAFFRGSLRIFSGSSETGERERPAVSAASRTRTGRTVGRSDGDWAEGAETTSVFRRRPGSGASRGADH